MLYEVITACGFGDILRTWTVTDCAGNTSSGVQTITIYDETAPVLSLPDDARFECEMGDAGMATAEDNCDGTLVRITSYNVCYTKLLRSREFFYADLRFCTSF